MATWNPLALLTLMGPDQFTSVRLVSEPPAGEHCRTPGFEP